MKYAIVSLSGRQYKFSEGDVITVDSMKSEIGTEINLDQVLMVVNDDKVQIGTPILEKSKIIAKVLNHKKGDKIRIATYKAKSRYRRVRGFRAQLTDLQIISIN